MAIAQCQSVPCGVHFITSPRTVARKLPSLLTRGGGVGVASFYNVIICSVSGSWDKCTGPEGRYMCRLSCIHSRSWRIFI